jgi:hypothetical protein
VLALCERLDEDRAKLYADLVLDSLNPAARRALEAEMDLKNYQLRREYLRKIEAQGRAVGVAQGQIEALVRALFAVLAARSLAVTTEQHALVESCVDPGQLEAWLVHAATAATADEIFDVERPRR